MLRAHQRYETCEGSEMIGQFLNLQGQITTAFYPAAGDCGVRGTVVAAWKNGGGLVRADANQSVPNSGWALAPCSGPQSSNPIGYGDPTVLPFSAVYLKPVPDNPGDYYEITQDFCVGTRVSFDVVAGNYADGAQNLQAI
jgi:hypothetical protein